MKPSTFPEPKLRHLHGAGPHKILHQHLPFMGTCTPTQVINISTGIVVFIFFVTTIKVNYSKPLVEKCIVKYYYSMHCEPLCS